MQVFSDFDVKSLERELKEYTEFGPAKNLYTLQLDEDTNIDTVLEIFNNNPSVDYIESGELSVVPYISINDPMIDNQRHIR
jgi:hypothetical protein